MASSKKERFLPERLCFHLGCQHQMDDSEEEVLQTTKGQQQSLAG